MIRLLDILPIIASIFALIFLFCCWKGIVAMVKDDRSKEDFLMWLLFTFISFVLYSVMFRSWTLIDFLIQTK